MSILIPILGVSIPLVVVIGKFIIEPLVGARGSGESAERMALLERRMAVLEQNAESIERSVTRLLEEAEFQRQLGSPAPPGSASGAAPASPPPIGPPPAS